MVDTSQFRNYTTRYDPGMGLDLICDALNLGLYIGVDAAADASPTISSAIIKFLQSGIGPVARTMQEKEREVSLSILDYATSAQKTSWAARDFATDMTSAISAAHTAAIAAGYQGVDFPAGGGLFTTLTWSPFVKAKALGHVELQTANASGRTIHISDEFGAGYSSGNSGIIFDGPFVLKNTNAANTAIAWSFGGTTSANGCNQTTALRGVETRSFHGGVYEFLYNSYILKFYGCFDYLCNGPRIVIANTYTNTGENICFFGCTAGDSSGSASTSYLLDVNTTHSMDLHFYGCSADYLLGLNKPANSAPLVKVNWFGGHLEWNITSAAYLRNDSGMTFTVDGAHVLAAATSGWPSPTVSNTTGTGYTKFVNIKYEVPSSATTHEVNATSTLIVDEYPNFQGASTPTTFVTYATGSSGGTISPKRPATTGWGIDFALKGTNAVAGSGTLDLPTGSGLVVIHDNTTGNQGFYRMAAGTVYTISVDTPFVAGAAGLNQIGLAWTGAVYQISNGYAASHDLYITLIKTRTSD